MPAEVNQRLEATESPVGEASLLARARASETVSIVLTTVTLGGWWYLLERNLAGFAPGLLVGFVAVAGRRFGAPSRRLPLARRAQIAEAMRTGRPVADGDVARAVVDEADWLLPHLQHFYDSRWVRLGLVAVTVLWVARVFETTPATAMTIGLAGIVEVLGVSRRITRAEQARDHARSIST